MNAAMELVARCGMHHPLLRLDSSVSSLPCRALWSAAREQLALARRCVCPEDKAVCLSNVLACVREVCHNVDNTTSDAPATSADGGLSGNGEPIVDGESSNAEAGASVVAAETWRVLIASGCAPDLPRESVQFVSSRARTCIH